MSCFGLGFHGVEVVEDGEALVEDGLAAEGEAVLRKVAEGHALDAGELAVVEGFDAGEDFEQRGFAGAVAADEAGALVRRDQPVGVFKEEFLAEAFAGGGELKHRLLFSHLVRVGRRRRTKDEGLEIREEREGRYGCAEGAKGRSGGRKGRKPLGGGMHLNLSEKRASVTQ